jgi:hypothetical protein
MIISHKYKFIFFPIPKTGTHSIRFALRPYLGPKDEEHVALFHHSKLITGNFEHRKNGHISVQEIRPWFSEDQWNSYYKFTFVRNPFDRFISACFFKYPFLKKEQENLLRCRAWLKIILQKEQKNSQTIFKPQMDFISNTDGEIAVDFIGKTENINKDFCTIANHLGLKGGDLQKINSTTHNPPSYYLDPELENNLRIIYKQDFLLYK